MVSKGIITISECSSKDRFEDGCLRRDRTLLTAITIGPPEKEVLYATVILIITSKLQQYNYNA